MRSAFQCTDICAHCVDDILLLCSVRQIYNQADRCKCLAGVEGWELFWKLGGAEVAGGGFTGLASLSTMSCTRCTPMPASLKGTYLLKRTLDGGEKSRCQARAGGGWRTCHGRTHFAPFAHFAHTWPHTWHTWSDFAHQVHQHILHVCK